MSQPAPPLGEMDMDEFRRQGHALIEWIATYLEQPEQYPVLSRSQPDEIKNQLPPAAPEKSEPMDDIIADFEQIIMPGITHWNHPNFYAYFGITASGPGILGELLMAALNVNGMLWRTSPAATELEEVVTDWVRQLLPLPASFEGVITDTASVSSLLSIAAARESLGLDIREKGTIGRDLPRLRGYISDQTHSSLEKGMITLGLGQENAVKIPSDEGFRMRPDALRAAIEADLAAGYKPFYICATTGTTSTTSVDPVAAIADIAQEYGLWLHVDGAYGGVVAMLPEAREMFVGLERADSFVVNPHKWLFTPIDCSLFYTRHVETLTQAFSLVPEYLRSAETDAKTVTDYMDYGIQLGRRFRALKLWLVMRHFGAEG